MKDDVLEIAKKLRKELTAAQVMVTDIINLASQLPEAKTRPACPTCGLTFKGVRGLSEHRYHQHDGPVPEHWTEAEALAAEPEKVAS